MIALTIRSLIYSIPSDLITILKEAVPVIEIKIKKHLKFEIFEWIHRVQTGIAKGEVNNKEDLTRNTKINYVLYNQILELQNLAINDNRTFECRITIRETLTGTPLEVNFNQTTNAHNFDIKKLGITTKASLRP